MLPGDSWISVVYFSIAFDFLDCWSLPTGAPICSLLNFYAVSFICLGVDLEIGWKTNKIDRLRMEMQEFDADDIERESIKIRAKTRS